MKRFDLTLNSSTGVVSPTRPKGLLVMVLCGMMVLSGCSTGWITTADSILAAAAPALVNILQIAALAQGSAFNQALATKINGDAAALKTELANYQAASAGSQPGICPQVQAALQTYESDLPAVLAAAQVSNANTQNKIETISALIVGVFGAIEPLIPGCSAPVAASVRNMAVHPAVVVDVKTFVSTYNAVLVSPTGNLAVDNATPKLKLHYHSKAVRVLTLGLAK